MKGLILIGVLVFCGSVNAGVYGTYGSYQKKETYGGGQAMLDVRAVAGAKHADAITSVGTDHINPNHGEKEANSGVEGLLLDLHINPEPIQTGASIDFGGNIHGHNDHKNINHEVLTNSANGIKEAHAFHEANFNEGSHSSHGQIEHNGQGLAAGSSLNLGSHHNIETGATIDTTGGIIGKEIHSIHSEVNSAAVHVVKDQLKAVDGIIDDLSKNLNMAIEKKKEIESFFANTHQGQKFIEGDLLTSYGFGTGIQGHHEGGRTLDINGGIHSNINSGASNLGIESHHAGHGEVVLGSGGLENEKKIYAGATTGGFYDGSGSGGIAFGSGGASQIDINGQPLSTDTVHLGGPVYDKGINLHVEEDTLEQKQKNVGNIGVATGTFNGEIGNHHTSEIGLGITDGTHLKESHTVVLNPNPHNVGVETGVISGSFSHNVHPEITVPVPVPVPGPDGTHQNENKISVHLDKSCAPGSLQCGLDHVGVPVEKDLNSEHSVNPMLHHNQQPHNHGAEKPFIDTTINGGIKQDHAVDSTLHHNQQPHNHAAEKPHIDTTINDGLKPVHPVDPLLHQNQHHGAEKPYVDPLLHQNQHHGAEKPYIDTTINGGIKLPHPHDPVLHHNQPHNHGDEKPYIDTTINGGIKPVQHFDPLLHHNQPGHSHNGGHTTSGTGGMRPLGVGPYGGGVTGFGGYGSTGGKGSDGSYGGIGIGASFGGYGNENYPPPNPYGGTAGAGYGGGYSKGHGAHGYGVQGYGTHGYGEHHGSYAYGGHHGGHHGPHGYGQIHNNYDGPVGGPNGYGPNHGFLGRGPFGGGISVGGYYRRR